jgi:hypothetical protein
MNWESSLENAAVRDVENREENQRNLLIRAEIGSLAVGRK